MNINQVHKNGKKTLQPSWSWAVKVVHTGNIWACLLDFGKFNSFVLHLDFEVECRPFCWLHPSGMIGFCSFTASSCLVATQLSIISIITACHPTFISIRNILALGDTYQLALQMFCIFWNIFWRMVENLQVYLLCVTHLHHRWVDLNLHCEGGLLTGFDHI